MAFHSNETYDYVGIVPVLAADGGFECALTSRDLPASRLPLLTGNAVRLVGRSPLLTVREAGVSAGEGARAELRRHAFVMSARRMDGAGVRTATFHVESTVVERLAPGDVLHLLCTDNGDLGVSVLRGGQLVTAIGPLAAMPLGEGIEVRWPTDLRDEITEVFRRRDPISGLTHAIFPSPLEVRVGDDVALVGRSRRLVGEFEVLLADGATGAFGIPTGFGSICRIGAGSRLGATLTAQLLMQDDALETEV
jgi:hypothetical protein